jgi:uncharacterized protein YfiM (DUF2279 family)
VCDASPVGALLGRARPHHLCNLAILLAISALSCATSGPDPWWGADKRRHLGLSAFSGVAGTAAVSALWDDGPLWARALAGAGVGLVPGLVKEGLDMAGLGEPSAKDLMWDAAGAVTGAGVTALVLWLLEDEPLATPAPPR